MRDQTEGRPIAVIEEFAPEILKTADGRPVLAMSLYATKPSDGRPVYAVSLLLDDGQVAQAVSFWSNGVLQTPDGRPVFAAALFDDAGAPDDLGGGSPTLLGTVLLPAQNPLPENAVATSTIGTLLNNTTGSTLTLTDDEGGRIAIQEYSEDVWILYRTGIGTLDYETEPTLSVTVRETLAGATNTPRDSVVTIQITNVLEAASLNALSGTFLLSETAAAGADAGIISDTTTGSTLSLVDSAGGRVQLVESSPGVWHVLRGATSLDYETATSHSFTVRETLADSPNSPRDTVLSLTVSDVSEGSSALATPVLARVSAAGAIPVQLGISSADYAVGFYGQLQISTVSSFATTTQSIVFLIDGENWARALQDIGLVDPSGTYYARVRLLRDNESGATTVTDSLGNTFNCDASDWSNTVTDTISVSVNAFADSDGINRSQWITGTTTPRLDFIIEQNRGAPNFVRGLSEITGKFHCELRIDGFANVADDSVMLAVVDSGTVNSFTTDLGARPGESTIRGCHVRVSEGGTAVGVAANGSSTTHNLGVTIAVGDYLILEGDPVARTVSVYVWDSSAAAGAGALVNGGAPLVTKTLTSLIPTNWYAAAGGRRGTGIAATSDSGTANFGGTTFKMTPTTGYNGW